MENKGGEQPACGLGGFLLFFGLATRLISIPLVFNFIVAYATASRATLVQLISGSKRLDAYDNFINDTAFPMLITALTMLAFGPGKVSIDHLIRRFILRPKNATTPPSA